ncbi:carboxymuconolactone decarboxylase family protein [Nocardioides convexus]|uniref:carboxymuconolactone decarboxylase family protein n=1 Tax=Nocardioides convexus TaxID=2712224 RepID=UPI00241861DE|nr:carboxymuconolactone decarboxylase family protein [Nocardioides convexus]
MILRVAALRSSAYELTQHRRLGRRAGLTEAEIAAIEAGAHDQPGLSDRERLLLRAADALVADQDLPDALWGALGAHFDDRERIEIVLLAGHYAMLATALHVLRVEPDRPR